MPRSRVIRPEFWSDEKLASLSRESRLTYAGLWGTSDDYGVTKGNTAWLRSQIFPYDEDLKISKFQEWLDELERIGRILPFSSDGEKYFYIPKFIEHQKVDKPSKNRNPLPPEDIESRVTREIVASDSRESSDETETDTETEFKQKQKPSCPNDFQKFWEAYPKKIGKIKAEEAWRKRNGQRPPLEAVLSKIAELKNSDQWKKDNGQYIPHPATWLNRGGWSDEVKTDVRSCAPPTWDD